MATETELERLVVKISADTTQLVAGLQKGTEALKSMASFATKTTKTIAGLIGIKLTYQGLWGLATAAESSELKLKQLEIAIRTNGGAVDQVLGQYKEFAAEVAKSTTTTKGETLSLLKRAEVMGFSGKEAEAVVKNSIALAGALGGEAAEHEHMAVQLARGNFHMAARALGLKRNTDETKLLAQVEKQLNAGLEMANAAGQTNEATIARLGKTFDGLKLQIGGIIAEGLHPFLDELEGLQTEYKNVEGQSKSTWENAKSHVKAWAEASVFAFKNFKVVYATLTSDIAHLTVKMANAWQWAGKEFINKFGGMTGIQFKETIVPTPLENELLETAEKDAQDMAAVFDKYQVENKSKFEKQGKGLGRSLGEGVGKGLKKEVNTYERIVGNLAFGVEALQKQGEFFTTGKVGGSEASRHHSENMKENQKQTGLLDTIAKNTKGLTPTNADLGGG